jgi:hypothetical protein
VTLTAPAAAVPTAPTGVIIAFLALLVLSLFKRRMSNKSRRMSKKSSSDDLVQQCTGKQVKALNGSKKRKVDEYSVHENSLITGVILRISMTYCAAVSSRLLFQNHMAQFMTMKKLKVDLETLLIDKTAFIGNMRRNNHGSCEASLKKAFRIFALANHSDKTGNNNDERFNEGKDARHRLEEFISHFKDGELKFSVFEKVGPAAVALKKNTSGIRSFFLPFFRFFFVSGTTVAGDFVVVATKNGDVVIMYRETVSLTGFNLGVKLPTFKGEGSPESKGSCSASRGVSHDGENTAKTTTSIVLPSATTTTVIVDSAMRKSDNNGRSVRVSNDDHDDDDDDWTSTKVAASGFDTLGDRKGCARVLFHDVREFLHGRLKTVRRQRKLEGSEDDHEEEEEEEVGSSGTLFNLEQFGRWGSCFVRLLERRRLL